MENNNQIRIKFTTVIVLMLIVAIIIVGILFIIINNNNDSESSKIEGEKQSQIKDKNKDTKINPEDIDLSLKNSLNSCGDNAYFTYDSQSHTVTIIGYGKIDLTKGAHYVIENMIDRGFGGSEDYNTIGELLFPEETEKIIITEGITEIRNKCGEEGPFLKSGGTYEKLKEIQLPNSITDLGDGCFANQTNLEIINIPNSITKIPDYAFYKCEKLNEIELPEGLKIIGYHAFSECNKLYYINFPQSLRIIEQGAFYKCATLPEVKLYNIKYISGAWQTGYGAFADCYNLKTIDINGDIDQLYSYTFDACPNLTNVTLTDNIKYISKDVWRHSKKVVDEEKIFSSREITKQFHPRDKDVTNIKELEKQIMNE